ncbi:cytochrome c oxidase subunit II [Paraburkholderia terrae]|uniref:cytochrome c oxidase subunit II n=1 Tax=Paraburkholderia terrae TaxID=311230 RepID=UPI001EE186FC|nr:cytochrome c oxidase subunit II [Paraburkholderia terrae]GJH05654.1 cytochrome c oxidase subunit II [Paraburkholderia terrae]
MRLALITKGGKLAPLSVPFVSPLAHADAPLEYFLHAAGPAATPTMHLGLGLTTMCVAVVAIIAVLLAGALVRRRPVAAPRALGKEEGGMGWIYIGVGVSTLALLASLFYTLVTLQAIAQPSLAPGLRITVTAYNWWWKIDYGDDPDPAHHLVTANEIHIPVGVPVRIALRSADVIHAFWVPRLAGKTQAIPGQVNTQWIQADAPGVYRGQCTQFCGSQHAHMAFDVVAQPQAEFDAWRDAQISQAASPEDGQARAGQKIFLDRCAGCHTVRGSDAAGVQAPDLTHVGSRRQLAAGTLTNTPEHLLDWVQHAQQIKPESLMPSLTLNVQDVAALSAYLATLH